MSIMQWNPVGMNSPVQGFKIKGTINWSEIDIIIDRNYSDSFISEGFSLRHTIFAHNNGEEKVITTPYGKTFKSRFVATIPLVFGKRIFFVEVSVVLGLAEDCCLLGRSFTNLHQLSVNSQTKKLKVKNSTEVSFESY